MFTTTLRIINPLGLHARAASKFVNVAKSFQAEVQLSRGAESVDGKRIMSVMLLAAPVGSDVELSVQGDDAEQAFNALCHLINDGFGELD